MRAVYAPAVRRITWFFLISTILSGGLLGAVLYAGARVGRPAPGELQGVDALALCALAVGIPGAVGLLISGVLELHDRLPRRQQL